jgi:hypothetical protein
MRMSELEATLRALDVAFPPTPDIAAAAEARLAAEQRRRPGRLARWLDRPRLVLAVTIVIAALGAVLAASPGARSAFFEIFGIEGAVVTRVERLPAVTPSESLAGLGERTTVAEARRRAGFALVEPKGFGTSDAVYFKAPGMVSFVYGRDPGVRLILSQIAGRLEEAFVKKLAAEGTEVRFVTVEGEPGIWLTGEPHFFTYVSRYGNFEEEAVYLADDVLLWEHGPVTLRLEGDFELEEALELAREVR